MEAITVEDKEIVRFIGRKLKINRGQDEFIGIVDGWVDIESKRHWVLRAENESLHFLPSEGWLVYAMDD